MTRCADEKETQIPDDEVTIRARFEGMDQAQQRDVALLRLELSSLGSGGGAGTGSSGSGPVMPANAPVLTTPTVVAGSGGAGNAGGGGTGIGTLGSLPPMAGGFVPGAALAPPSVRDGGSGAAGPGAGGGGIVRARPWGRCARLPSSVPGIVGFRGHRERRPAFMPLVPLR